MRSKRFVIVFLCAILTLMFLPTPSTTQGQEAINLSISCTCNAASATWIETYVIPEFQAYMAEQGKTVTVEVLDLEFTDEQYREQLALDFSLEQGSDIYGFDGFWAPEFVEAGLILPLNQIAGEVVDEWDGWDHIPADIQNILSYNGERYGIPRGTDVRSIYYRVDVFEAAGIEMPWQPQSWQDIIDTANILKEAGIEIPLQINASTLMGEATTMQGYFMVLLGAGAHMYDFEQEKWVVNSPEILNALYFYHTLYVEQGLAVTELQMGETARDDTFNAFKEGRVGMLVEGDYFWRSVLHPERENGFADRNELVGWAKMPAMEPGAGYNGQDFVSISGGTGWIMNPHTPHPAETWELLAFMSSQTSAAAIQDIDPGISFRDDVDSSGDMTLTVMSNELLPLTTIRPLLPEYPQVSYEAQLMVERVITGEMTPEEAMQAYDEAVTAIVGEENVIRIPLE